MFLHGLGAQAALFRFDISPKGSDLALGLSPGNELFGGLPPEASTGSGNTLGAGITFESNTGVFSFDFGYGSAFGFSDLSEPGFSWLLHGGASSQATGPAILDFQPFHTFAADPGKGGRVTGSLTFPVSWRDELLSDLTYINIYTDNNPGGEIRGQLVLVHDDVAVIPETGTATSGLVTAAVAFLWITMRRRPSRNGPASPPM